MRFVRIGSSQWKEKHRWLTGLLVMRVTRPCASDLSNAEGPRGLEMLTWSWMDPSGQSARIGTLLCQPAAEA